MHCFAWLTVASVFSLTPLPADELSLLQGKPLTYVYVVVVVVVTYLDCCHIWMSQFDEVQ